MSGESALDPRTLTFSQANGYEELPQPLKLGELSNLAEGQAVGCPVRPSSESFGIQHERFRPDIPYSVCVEAVGQHIGSTSRRFS